MSITPMQAPALLSIASKSRELWPDFVEMDTRRSGSASVFVPLKGSSHLSYWPLRFLLFSFSQQTNICAMCCVYYIIRKSSFWIVDFVDQECVIILVNQVWVVEFQELVNIINKHSVCFARFSHSPSFQHCTSLCVMPRSHITAHVSNACRR